jgi:hypothetical protein
MQSDFSVLVRNVSQNAVLANSPFAD